MDAGPGGTLSVNDDVREGGGMALRADEPRCVHCGGSRTAESCTWRAHAFTALGHHEKARHKPDAMKLGPMSSRRLALASFGKKVFDDIVAQRIVANDADDPRRQTKSRSGGRGVSRVPAALRTRHAKAFPRL